MQAIPAPDQKSGRRSVPCFGANRADPALFVLREPGKPGARWLFDK
jgi:hypothetical protein